MTLSGFLIGGAIPAICLGLGTVFMRASLGAGALIPLYLAVVGSVATLNGWAKGYAAAGRLPAALPNGWPSTMNGALARRWRTARRWRSGAPRSPA